VEIVADEDVGRARPFDQLAVRTLEADSTLTLPDAFLALPASSQRVEGPVPAEFDVDEEIGQVGPRRFAVSRTKPSLYATAAANEAKRSPGSE
jgi:hypothetical protein